MSQNELSIWLQFAFQQMAAESYLANSRCLVRIRRLSHDCVHIAVGRHAAYPTVADSQMIYLP